MTQGELSTRKYEYDIHGLHCSHCAMKIEDGLKKHPLLKNVKLDFVNGRLVVETAVTEKMKEIESEMQGIINNIESGVTINKAGNMHEMHTHNHEHEHHHHHLSHGKRKVIQLILGALHFFIALFLVDKPMLQFGLFAGSYVILGGEVIWQALKNIKRGQVFDENFLMALATVGAIILGEYPEAVAVMLFYQVGEYLQDLAVDHSRRSIKELMNIRPDHANLMKDDNIVETNPELVHIGDKILIKPGEKVPLDGIVLEGHSNLDTSPLTGEPVPRTVKHGDEVMAGMINNDGVLVVEVTKPFSQSAVAKILELVQNASAKKAPTERFITRFAKYYTPAVVIIAVSIAVIPPLIINEAQFSQWLYRALIFLVVSCPCALLVSIPLGFFGGIGSASKKGILVKGGNYLEALNKVEGVVFDKTGTLTKGVFKIKKIHPQEGITQQELLDYAGVCESLSNHPIAQSIRTAWGGSASAEDMEAYGEVPGAGVKVSYKGKMIIAGNEKMMLDMGVAIGTIEENDTIVHVAYDGKYLGYLTLGDEIKEDAPKAISDLKSMGVKDIVMLTGDYEEAARKTAQYLGLTGWHAGLLPQHKVNIVEEMAQKSSKQKKKGALVFVGDGINDAPVLARADVGVAMGALGSDAAIEAADVVLMTDQPSQLVTAMKMARTTNKIVWQNIFLALGVKGLVLLLGAGGLATMWEAVFADVGVALLAVLNSMRILKSRV